MGSQIKVLFICTANACRSQMAEALLRHRHGQKFEACSAGSYPAGYVHPLAVHAMETLGVPIEGQRSKSWHEFQDIPVDLVITVCQDAAGETCPVWPGAPLTVNWPLPDPAGFVATDEQIREAAVLVAKRITTKLDHLAELDFNGPPDQLLPALKSIAEA